MIRVRAALLKWNDVEVHHYDAELSGAKFGSADKSRHPKAASFLTNEGLFVNKRYSARISLGTTARDALQQQFSASLV